VRILQAPTTRDQRRSGYLLKFTLTACRLSEKCLQIPSAGFLAGGSDGDDMESDVAATRESGPREAVQEGKQAGMLKDGGVNKG